MKFLLISLVALVFVFSSQTLADMRHEHHDEHSLPMDKVKTVECPVTKTKLNPTKAFAKTVYKGKTYYFCCASCPEEFKKNPEKYTRPKKVEKKRHLKNKAH